MLTYLTEWLNQMCAFMKACVYDSWKNLIVTRSIVINLIPSADFVFIKDLSSFLCNPYACCSWLMHVMNIVHDYHYY